jgi:virulence-associated protein VagC
MLATAKVFTIGRSQAIRLPKAFRVDVHEMWNWRWACPW